MAVVVNADDFGLSQKVTLAICEAFEKGLVDRTTVMANMPYAREAMDLAAKCGFAGKVGLHINLTAGKPLTEDIAKDPVMCGKNGEFSADFARNIRTRFYLPKTTRDNVEKELRAQLDMYRQLGGTLWHIDSHHHVHTDPSVWCILKRVIKDYPVTSVRLGRNMYHGGNPLLHIYKAILNRSIRTRCATHPKYFGSASDYREFIKSRPDVATHADVEVMVHPVYDNEKKLADLSAASYLKLERL